MHRVEARVVTLVAGALLLVCVSSHAWAAGDTLLIDAVKAADRAAAQALLQKRANPNEAEPDGTTALHWAVRNDDLALVDRLIRAGAKPAVANRFGVTPLYLACVNGSPAVVERLLSAGVSANSTAPYGETALMTCARTGNVDAVRALITRGASIDAVESWHGQTALMWAAAQGNADAMRLLIEAGADVNARSAVVTWERQRTAEPRDKWLPPGGLTSLHFAAREGCVACIDVLVSHGADINAIDPQGMSALVNALINGHYDVAGALIDRGIDLNIVDDWGRTALYAAVDDNTMPVSNRPSPKELDNVLSSLDVIKMILERGAKVDVPLTKQAPYRTKLDRGGDGVLGAGTTPLIRAAKGGDATVVKMLLEKGANPQAKTSGRTSVNALMIAAGVGTNESDMTGRTRTQQDTINTIQLLLDAGVDVNAPDSQGRTAAHGAAQWGYAEVVKFLASKGARLDLKDKSGLTPLHAAMGLAGGLGFGGQVGTVHEETVKVIRDVLGPAADAIAADVPKRTETTPVDPDN